MIKTATLTLLVILSSLNVTAACADSDFIPYTATNVEKKSTSLKEDLEQLENSEQLRIVCDKQKKAEYCFTYAAYQDLVLENYKLAYEYHMKAFVLGQKESGYYIGAYQVNYLDLFNYDTRLNIDEIIYYLEQAFKAGYPDATSLLMVIYRDTEFNRIDFDKSEYYNKTAIEQNIEKSRVNLAYLYMHHMKDKSKITRTIELLNEDLMLEKNWESALALMTIHLYPEEYGANLEPDLVKTLAYAYVSSDLRDGRYEDEFNGVDTRFADYSNNKFEETFAHELGHTFVSAYRGDYRSLIHEGSSTVLQAPNDTYQYPTKGELDLMKYARGEPKDFFERVVANGTDVKGLLWASRLEIN